MHDHTSTSTHTLRVEFSAQLVAVWVHVVYVCVGMGCKYGNIRQFWLQNGYICTCASGEGRILEVIGSDAMYVSAQTASLEKGLSNRQLKYTVMKRKQCVSFLAGLVVRIILIYLEVPI